MSISPEIMVNDNYQTREEAMIEIDLKVYGIKPGETILYSELKPQSIQPHGSQKEALPVPAAALPQEPLKEAA